MPPKKAVAASKAKASPRRTTAAAKTATPTAKPATAKAKAATAKTTPRKATARKATTAGTAATRKATPRKATPRKATAAAPRKATAKTTSRPSTKATRKAAKAGATKARSTPAAKATPAGTEAATRTRALATPAKPVDHSALRLLGLSPGERVRFRRQLASRWTIGVVVRRERDGSIGLTDPNGAARAIPIDRIEVGCKGPRGARSWEPLTVRASRSEQLQLL